VSEFRVFINRKPGLRLESVILSFLSISVYTFRKLCGRVAANVIIVYICFPTGAGELPAIWPRGSSREGTLAKPPASTNVRCQPRAQGDILKSRTFTYRPACCLTKWSVAQWGRPFTK
jgi:hypothetical protein